MGRWDYVDEIQKADLDEAFIKRTYGAGAYKITLMRADGTIADNIKFSIYGAAPAATTPAAAAGAMSDSIIVAMINSQSAMMTAMLTAVAGKNQGVDVAALIQAVKPTTNPIQDLATLHELTKATGGDNAGGFALLEKAIDMGLVKSTIHGDEKGDTFLSLLREVMPELKSAIRAAQVPDRPALPNPQRRRKPMRPWVAAIYEVREFLPTFAKTSKPSTAATRLLDLATPAQIRDFELHLRESKNDLNPMHAELMAALGPLGAAHGAYLVDTLNELGRKIAEAHDATVRGKKQREKKT